MENVTASVSACDCDDAKCVNKAVHEENLGYSSKLENLQSYNAYSRRKINDVLKGKTDKEIYDVDAEGITISPTTVTDLPIGDQVKLAPEPTVFTKNPPVVVWESSDVEVAQVDSDGIVLAKKVGTVTITATDFENTSVSATIEINVVDPNAPVEEKLN